MKICRSLVAGLCLLLSPSYSHGLPPAQPAAAPQYQQLFSLPAGVAIVSGMAVDAAGNIYLVGSTESASLPTSPGAFQPVYGGGACYSPGIVVGGGNYFPCDDAFVLTLDPTGRVIYSPYLGGGNIDEGVAIAADAAGN